MQQQSNVLLCFENLSEEHANLVYAHESCKEMKARYKECKKEISAYDENVSAYDQLLKDYNGVLNIEKGLNKRVEELKGEKKGLENVNAKLTVGKGFIDGISIGRKEEDVHAIFAETPNVDLAALLLL
ncbi:hypothetical protein Tco_1026402 [Tanacetum coccineum]